LALSYILVSLSSTLFVASVIIFANSLFIDSEGEYKRVESLSSLHLSKNICIELIRFDGGESIINPTLICSKNRENIEATIYSGHLGYNFVSLQKRVVKLTLVDVYITLENGEPSQALNLVTRYIALNPEDIDGYYTRGKIEFKLQKYSKALQDMEKILDINPHYLKAYLEIDKILARVKRWEKIVEFWTRFTKLEPENPRGYLERAGAFYFWGKLDLAKKDLEKSCELGSIKGCREKRRLFK
jgi:tetratricopeptide (TPR) repeat protein